MRRLYWFLYQMGLFATLLVAGPILLLSRGKHYLPTLRGRFGGRSTPAEQPQHRSHPLWIHAVSVGEVEVAATFLRRAGERVVGRALVTTVTPTGQDRARALVASRATVAYLPFEFAFAQRAFFRAHAPGCLVLVEGELWPLLQHRLQRRKTPIVMINGRISDRSFARLHWLGRRVPALLGPLLDPVDHFGVQTGQDQNRLLALGVAPERISVTGNLKFDADPPLRNPELETIVNAVANGRKVIVAGSTMPGEEALVLDAFAETSDLCTTSATEAPLLVLAPRHPERFDQVDRLCRDRELSVLRRTTLVSNGTTAHDLNVRPGTQVLLLDTLGELAPMYYWADAAFVGGTLVPTGGHNPLEPARCGVPVAVGPSMENFKEIADAFDQQKAWQRVSSAAELGSTWHRWLYRQTHPSESSPRPTNGGREDGQGDTAMACVQRASALLEANKGATERSLALVARFTSGALRPSPVAEGDPPQ